MFPFMLEPFPLVQPTKQFSQDDDDDDDDDYEDDDYPQDDDLFGDVSDGRYRCCFYLYKWKIHLID